MDRFYNDSINKALKFIDENIDKKISLNAISEASGISKFHFHRVFEAFTGESVYDAIIRLRIEKGAGLLLKTTSMTVAEAAGITGFGSSAEFSRTFKKRFGNSPTAWRQAADADSIHSRTVKTQTETESGSAVAPVSTGIRKLDEFSIAYLRHTGAYAGDTALFIYLYNKLTAWAASQNLLSPERHNVVVYHDPVRITEDPRTKISLGISVPDDIKTSRDIGKMKIRGGSYIICRYSLRDEEYTPAWRQVYRRWLPEQGFKPADGFCFESYPLDVKSEDRHSSIVDICVPVEKL